MRWSPLRVLLRVLLVFLGLLISNTGRTDSGHTFTFRIRGEPETLDWNRAHTLVEASILTNLMEGLVSTTPELKVTPALAESWTLSPDQKIYRFRLRSGVKWSDGVPLQAKDFVESWKRLLSPLTAAAYAYLLFDIEGAEAFNAGKLLSFDQVGIKALDQSTLEIKLIRPVAHWISIPAFWVTFPIRKDIIDEFGASWEAPGKMVNLGPFSLVTHEFGNRVVLKKNSNYYGQQNSGNVEQIIAQVVGDDKQALSLFESNKIDLLTDISGFDLKQLKGRSEFKTFSQLKTGYIGFVTNKYPVSNLKVRKAIAMAIDKSIFQGELQAASSFVPPPLLGYSKKTGLPFDPVRARKELRESGLDLSIPLKLEYLLPNWDKSVSVAKIVQEQLNKNLGIQVTLNSLENKAFRDQLDLNASPAFDATWTADYPDPDNFLSVFLSQSGNSRTQWKNDKFDELVQKGRDGGNSRVREGIYFELQRILQEEAVVIVPLYYEPNFALVSKRAKKLQLNPMDYLYLRNVDVVP